MKALQDVTIIDLTHVAAGPFCTMHLADMGATVIKVESRDLPDVSRGFTPFLGEGEDRISGYYVQYNRNKKGITLNLKTPEGRELLKKLVAKADAVIENYRPGVTKKLGIDYDVLKQVNPRLIYVAITGYGQYGPYVARPAFDTCAQALSGMWSINGYPDRFPVRVGTILGDLSAGLYAAIGLLAALHHARKTGEGQFVDIAQLDATMSLTETMLVNYMTEGKIQRPLGNVHPFVMPYETFDTKDGAIFFGGYTDKFWDIACGFFGEPEYAKRPDLDTMEKRQVPETYQAQVKPKLVEWFSRYTVAELMDGLADLVPIVPINDVSQVASDPQVRARDMVVEKEYPQGTVGILGQPIKLSVTPPDPTGDAPRLGEHNRLVYSELLGLTEAEITDLEKKGVL